MPDTMPEHEMLWRTRRIAILLERIAQRTSMSLSENCMEWIALVKVDSVTDKRMKLLLGHVLACTRSLKPKNDYEKADIDIIIADIEYVEKGI